MTPPPDPRSPNIFGAGSVDRAAHRRTDGAWWRELLADPATRLVPVWRALSLVEPSGPRAALPRLGERRELLERARVAIWLGEVGGARYVAVDLSLELEEQLTPLLTEHGELTDLKRVGALLPAEEASLLAAARALVYWHERHLFCGACGRATASRDAGHLRRCTGCGLDHFPRTDPCVIMLVTCGELCLLGRQASWPTGQYATLAGFVEPGESLEMAVAREVFEEAGVRVRGVSYHSSQPWPFPASLMVGFYAEAEDLALHLDGNELEDARWFERAELKDPGRRPIRLPSEVSISRRLVDDWLTAG